MKSICLLLITLFLTPISFAQTKAKRRTHSKLRSSRLQKPDPLALLVADVDPPDNWKLINRDLDGVRYYYDTSTLKRNGNTARMWMGEWPSSESLKNGRWRKEKAKSATAEGRNGKDYEHYYRSLNLWECHCEFDTYRVVEVIDYADDGHLIFNKAYNNSPWSNAAPGTLSESLVKTACGK